MHLMVRVCNYDRMNIERFVARTFVVLGGLFWAAAAFGADFGYRDKSVLASSASGLLLLAIAAVAFGLGLFYERLVAIVLAVGALGVVAWGLIAGWESGVWMAMGVVLIAPMIISGLLYWLAAQTQIVCSLDE